VALRTPLSGWQVTRFSPRARTDDLTEGVAELITMITNSNRRHGADDAD
jgi:hypothetical protein